MNTETVAIETITPARAQQLLNASKGNRRMDAAAIAAMARQMAAGQWHVTPEGIGLTDDGVLVDGHHRLRAIIDSGETVRMIVLRGMAKEAVPVINTGRSRSYQDASVFAGWKLEKNSIISAVKFAEFGKEFAGAKVRLSHAETHILMEKHRAALDVICSHLGKNFRRGVIVGVLLRAYYAKPNHRTRLARFCEVLTHGVSESLADTAAIRLRDFVLRLTGSNATVSAELYEKTQAAVKAFLETRPLSKINGLAEEAF